MEMRMSDPLPGIFETLVVPSLSSLEVDLTFREWPQSSFLHFVERSDIGRTLRALSIDNAEELAEEDLLQIFASLPHLDSLHLLISGLSADDGSYPTSGITASLLSQLGGGEPPLLPKLKSISLRFSETDFLSSRLPALVDMASSRTGERPDGAHLQEIHLFISGDLPDALFETTLEQLQGFRQSGSKVTIRGCR
jgi:hypothetical protein